MNWFQLLIGPDNGDANAAQLSVRAIIIFAFGILCIRVTGRRTFSQATPFDIIVALVVGSNLSRAMTGKAPFIASLCATLVLVVLHRAAAVAALRWHWVDFLIKSRPIVLIRDGVADPVAMRRGTVSRADLLEGLRGENQKDIEDIELAVLESSGKISVVRKPL